MGLTYVAVVCEPERPGAIGDRRIVVLGDGPARDLDWPGLPVADPRDWRWDWGPGNPGTPITAAAILHRLAGLEASPGEVSWFADQVVAKLPAGEGWQLGEAEIVRCMDEMPLVLGQLRAEGGAP
jgi:hypothetical protein